MMSDTPPLPKPQASILHQILRREKIALSLIFLIMLLDVIGITILFPISAYIVKEYSNQAIMVTLLTVIYSAAQFFAAPVIGKISDRVGRRPVLLVCLAGASVGYFMFGIAGALWVLFLSRLIAGITGGSLSTASAYIVDVSKPEELANAFTLMGMAWGIGLVLGPALGGALGQINLRLPAFFSAGLAFFAMCMSFFYLPESLPQDRRETTPMRASDLNTFQSIGAIGRLPGLAVILLASCLFNFAFGAMGSTETLFLIQRFNILPWQLGLMSTLVGITLATMQAILLPRLAPRLGEILLTSICMLIMTVGALAMRYNPIFLLIFPIAIGRSSASGFIFPLMGTISARRVTPKQQGQLMGVSTSLNSLMGIVSPILAGLMYDYVSPGSPYWLAAVFFAAAAFILRTEVPAPRLKEAGA
jgi:MFS transporter, DHA1 family, tetracycline resistance protein